MTALLHEHVTRQADRRPDAGALVMGSERLTYAELELASGRLARLLHETGCRPGDRVALLIEKSPAAVIAMHAALRAGCMYVPIDVGSPAPRIDRIIRSAEPRAVLAAGGQGTLVDDLLGEGGLSPQVSLGWLGEGSRPSERWRPAFARADVDAADPLPAVARRPEDVAHLLFTSGSTGVPKGVAITHANVGAFIAWANDHFGVSETDRVSGHPPLHFDLSTADIYGTFRAGAELHLIPAGASLDARALVGLVREAELTQWFSVPSVMTYLARFGAVDEADFPALRRVLWCGEVLPTPVLKHWMVRLPHATFTNLYGPTEATIASSFHTVAEPPADESTPIPIGRACPGEELLVLDEQLRPVAPDQVGDLFIAGVGLSPGYWRDEEKTRTAFLADPRGSNERIYKTGDLARVDRDGVFHFLGRADAQIKSRGYRIELGEIEAALHTLDELAEAAVVAIDSERFAGKVICCAYSSRGGSAPTPGRLRERLGEQLPSYMLPARWVALEHLPQNLNGKIDRPALRSLFSTGEAPPAAEPAQASGRAG